MRSTMLTLAALGALTFGSTRANAQVGIMIGNPLYGTGIGIGAVPPYYGTTAVVPYGGVGYRPGVSIYSGPTFYSSGYTGYVAPVPFGGVAYVPRYYGRPGYYSRPGLFGRRVYRRW